MEKIHSKSTGKRPKQETSHDTLRKIIDSTMERNPDTPGFHGRALSRAYFGTLNLGYVGFYAAIANDLLNEANSSGERGL